MSLHLTIQRIIKIWVDAKLRIDHVITFDHSKNNLALDHMKYKNRTQSYETVKKEGPVEIE